ncbi:hypothetical protein [Burkholderia pseudomultivorans]|uniref:hypothetical protein n=1 Tax=Burkholderia pseudomultivorans TaxID=1207504 RepID=UPI00075AACC3|nr:hypothetical protein [Burkholderia pseudomultivorans]KWE99317.1 hypothetical protein WT55_05055 [Burkholderia pseudomultivorans]
MTSARTAYRHIAISAKAGSLHAEQLLYLPGVRQARLFMVLKEILSTHALPVWRGRASLFRLPVGHLTNR